MKRLEEHLKQLPCIGWETIQEEWDLHTNTIQQIAEEVLGRQVSRKKNEWFDKDCERATKEKNEVYLIMQQQHGTQNKSSDTRRKEERRRKYIRKESKNGKRSS